MHGGDLDTVLADHADALVMFDAPPPDDGVREIAAYGETWRPSSSPSGQGRRWRSCRSTSPPGDDIAFAGSLLRCGTPDESGRDPANRLRLTVGLRKQDGRRMVTREHHSFPDKS